MKLELKEQNCVLYKKRSSPAIFKDESVVSEKLTLDFLVFQDRVVYIVGIKGQGSHKPTVQPLTQNIFDCRYF